MSALGMMIDFMNDTITWDELVLNMNTGHRQDPEAAIWININGFTSDDWADTLETLSVEVMPVMEAVQSVPANNNIRPHARGHSNRNPIGHPILQVTRSTQTTDGRTTRDTLMRTQRTQQIHRVLS